MTGRARHRSLDYRRTRYRPGLGICSCKPCREETKARRDSGEDYRTGEPYDRCEYVNRELVFAERWEDENQARPGINFGMGILQDLLVVQKNADGFWNRGRVAFWVSKRERVIVATVIQWLGTNCGWCFLEQCVRACGFRLVPDDRPLPPRPRPQVEAPPRLPRHLGRFVHLIPGRDRERRRGQGGAEGVE